jgi:hypothetical protein
VSEEYDKLLQERQSQSPRNLFLEFAITDLKAGKSIDEIVSGFELSEPYSTKFRSDVTQIDQLGRDRTRGRGLETAVFSALMAVAGCISLYVIGWGVAWIRRGFSG